MPSCQGSLGSLWSNSTGPKAAPKAASAPAQPTAKAGKRRLLVDTDDEDDGTVVPDKAVDKSQDKATDKAQDKGTDKAKSGGKASKAKAAASPAKGAREAKAGRAGKPAPSAPTADGGKKRRKVLKTHINDKGEEETVIEWVEEETEGDAAGGAAAGDAPVAPRPAPACVGANGKLFEHHVMPHTHTQASVQAGKQAGKEGSQAIQHYCIFWEKVTPLPDYELSLVHNTQYRTASFCAPLQRLRFWRCLVVMLEPD